MDDPLGLVGTTIAEKYRVERLLGQGGFGVVYAGTQLLLRQPVAIKLIKPGAPGSTAFTAATFLREAKLLFGLTHPGIVRMYDVGEAKTSLGPAPYVILELIEGTTLAEQIGRRRQGHAPPFGPHELRAIFEPVIDALAFAHARGIVHRDLKPSNIMVLGAGPTMTAKVLDFGMADGAPDLAITSSGSGLTPLYAAPEQWNPTYGTVGPATDVFALGLCIEEAATLTPAVAGDTIPAIVASATNPSRSSRIAAVRPDLPRPLEQVVVRATRVSPPDRFASAGDLLGALRQAFSPSMLPPPSSHAPSTAPMTTVPASPYAATVGTSMPAPAPVPAPTAPPLPPKSNVGLIVGLVAGGFVLLGLAVVGLAALFLLHGRDEEKPIAIADAGAPTVVTPPAVIDAGTPRANATSTTKPTPTVAPTVTIAKDAGSAPPAPTPTPPAPPSGPAIFSVTPSGERTGLDPDFPKFTAVIAKHGPGLESCFRHEQANTPEWSARIDVSFGKDGGRGARVAMRRNGQDDTSATAERVKDCLLPRVPLWPWPSPPGFAELDGGRPRLTMHARWAR